MSQELIYQFLKDTLGVKVHQDLVPETAQLPSASYYIVSEPTEGALKGGVDLRRYNATCDVVTNNRLTTNEYVNKLKTFENFTTHGDFQLIRITNVNQTPRTDSNVKIFQTSVDLEFTMRRSGLY
ncbi:hypothetical protein VPHK394_0011 [Vibrio phage K394]